MASTLGSRLLSMTAAFVVVTGQLWVPPAAALVDPVAIETITPQVTAVGTTIVVAGHGFSAVANDNTVQVNGRAATVTAAAVDRLDVTVPSGATSGPVTVTSPDGSATSTVDLYVPPSPFVPVDVQFAQRLALGTGTVAAIATSGKIALLTFPGQAGHAASVALTAGTFGTSSSTAKVAVYAPDGTVFVALTGFGNGGLFLDRKAMTQNGTYTVLIDPQGTAVGQVTVTAHDVPIDSVVAATFGTPIDVATTVPGQNGNATFNGVVGQRVSLQLAASTYGSSSGNAKVSLVKPDGTNLVAPTGFGTSGTYLDAVTLPAAGLYRVLVDPQAGVVGQVSVTVHNVPADATASASPGSSVVLTTTVPGQNGLATFDGLAGQRVSWKLTKSASISSSSAVYVRKPDGTTLTSATYLGSSGTFLDVKALPVTGTYTVFFDPNSNTIGSLTIDTYDVPADVAAPIVAGTPLTVTTTVPGQNAVMSFDGVAGQRFSWKILRSASVDASSAVYVRKPDGTTLTSATYLGSSGTFLDVKALPASGTYTILFDPASWSVGSLTVDMYDVAADVVAPIVAGTPLTVTTTAPGQNAVMSFDGVAGQRFSWKLTRGSTVDASSGVYVRKPDGTTLTSATYLSSSGTFLDVKALPVSGTYTILFDPASRSVGSLTVDLYDVAADPVVPAVIGAPAVTAETITPGQNASVTFEATSGQRVSVHVTGSTYGSSNVTGTLLKPDGTTLVGSTNISASGTLFGPVNIAATGTYTLVLNPQNWTVGRVNVRPLDVSDASVGTTIGGGQVVVNTATPGQNAAVTFPGTAGQRIAVNITGNTYGSGNVTASLLKPDGTALIAASTVYGEKFLDSVVLPVDGTYTVWLDPQGTATGEIKVEVYAVPADLALTANVNEDVTAAIGTPGQNGAVTFAGTSGQRISVSLISTANGNIPVTLRKPDGTTLWSSTLYSNDNNFVDTVSLPATGTYTLWIDPSGSVTGSVTAHVYDVPADPVGTIVLDGSPISLNTTVPGQAAKATFTGTTGQRVAFDLISTGADTVPTSLRKPDGTALWSQNLYGQDTRFVDTVVLPVDGTYTILVDPSGSGLAAVTVKGYLVPADVSATIVPDGVPVTVTTTVPGQNAVLNFSVPAGRQILVAADIPVSFNSSVTFKVSNPDGTQLQSWSNSGSTQTAALGPITTVAAGQHTLTVNPSNALTGSIMVRLFDATPPAALTTTIGGPAVRVVTNAPGQTADLTFTGVAGQRVAVVAAEGSFRDAAGHDYYTVALRQADGTVLKTGGGRVSPFLVPMAILPATGTYTLRVDPESMTTGSTMLQVHEVPADVAVSTTVGGGQFNVDFPVPGMTATISVNATVGQPLSLAAAGVTGGSMYADFYDQAGTLRCSRSLSSGGSTSCNATTAGTYQIKLASNNTAVGTWLVEVYDGLGSPVISTDPATTPSTWSSAASLEASWYVRSTASIGGYVVVVDQTATTDPGTVIPQTATSTVVAPVADGVYYLHVRAITTGGYAGPITHYPIRIDRTVPTVSAVVVTSHPDPETPVATLDLQATVTADSDVSGVVGFAVSVTHGADDVPLGDPLPGTSLAIPLRSEGEWYLHVVAVDGAGNRSAVTTRKVLADIAPSAPRIASLTHPVGGTAYPHSGFVASWDNGESAASSWAVALDHDPDTVATVETFEPRHTAQLTPGTWWLHVRGRDAGGSWGASSHFQVVVSAASVAFQNPRAGSSIWGSVDIVLSCTSSLNLTANGLAIGQAVELGDGSCKLTWDTSTVMDGAYRLNAGNGDHPVIVANGLDTVGRLQADYAAGVLTVADYVRYLLYSVIQIDQVPARYTVGAAAPGEEHSAVLETVLRLWRAMPLGVQSELESWLTPTVLSSPSGMRAMAQDNPDCGWQVKLKNLTFECVAESDHFKLYYFKDGVGPYSPGKQRPDLVQMVMDSLEQARTVYGGNMGYNVTGGKLTVAFDPMMLPGSGLSLPEDGYCPFNLFGCQPIIFLDTDHTLITKHLPWHEYFHHVQYQYMDHGLFYSRSMNWWMEATAEWAAHRMEFWTNESIGGYYGSLDEFLAESHERFDDGDTVLRGGGPEYGAFIVGEYLEQRLGADAIRQTWERLRGSFPPLPGDVISELLEEKRVEGSFPLEIEKFRQWAYVLDANGTQNGFQDQDAYKWWSKMTDAQGERTAPHDTVTLESQGNLDPQTASGTFDIEESGAKYVEIKNPLHFDGDLTITFDADEGAVRGSVLLVDERGKPAAACGDWVGFGQNEPHLISLDRTCPRAFIAFVYASTPGYWADGSDGDYQISFARNGVVLSNNTVDLGVNAMGNLYSPSGISLRLHGDAGTESIQNGCQCEGWGISGGGAGGSVTGAQGVTNLTLKDFSVIGNLAMSTVEGPNGLSVIHQFYSSGATSNLFTVQIIVSNNGTTALDPVKYRRAVDWDPMPDLYQSYNTFESLGGDTSYITGVTNDGFADPNPTLPLTDLGANGWFTDFGPDDTGALIEINLGKIEPGKSKMFSLYYGTARDEASARAAAVAVGAQAVSFGQVNTDEGRDLGKPYTAILAVNGTNLTSPPSGPHGMSRLQAKLWRLDEHTTVLGASVPGVRPPQEGAR